MQEVDLSVCFVNYNSGGYLADCLLSLIELTAGISYEVIVVDNNSNDDSLELAKTVNKDLILIKNIQNVGFSAANNQAIRISNGRHILLLNNDILLKNNVLKMLVEFQDSHPESGACGGKLESPEGRIQNQCKRGMPTPWNILSHLLKLDNIFPSRKLFGGYLLTYLDPNVVNEVEAISGACMMISRDALDKVKGLDEDFFLYGEDIDLCLRIRKSGWKIFYVPQARLIHYGEKGSRADVYNRICQYYRSMFIFYNKHYRAKYPFYVNWSVYAGISIIRSIHFIRVSFLRHSRVASKK